MLGGGGRGRGGGGRARERPQVRRPGRPEALEEMSDSDPYCKVMDK